LLRRSFFNGLFQNEAQEESRREIVLRCAVSVLQLRHLGGPAWPIRIYGNSSSGWRRRAN
jgi:hypothetical protein